MGPYEAKTARNKEMIRFKNFADRVRNKMRERSRCDNKIESIAKPVSWKVNMLRQTVLSQKNIKGIIKMMTIRGIKISSHYEIDCRRKKIKMSCEFTNKLLELGGR